MVAIWLPCDAEQYFNDLLLDFARFFPGWRIEQTAGSVVALAYSGAPRCAADYQSKVSGPMLDRIDLHVEVDPFSAADLALPPPAKGSEEVRARVAAARAIQSSRSEQTGARTNAELDGEGLEFFGATDEAGRNLPRQAAEAMRLSALRYTRMLTKRQPIAPAG